MAGSACPLPCPDNNQDGICDGTETPDPGPFEPVDLIGLPEAEAVALAAKNGYTTDVVRRDDQYYHLATVVVPNRILLSIDGGIVTGVRVG